MTMDRRNLLLRSAALTSGALLISGRAAAANSPAPGQAALADAVSFGIDPSTSADQTQMLQKAIERTATVGSVLHLPAGTYRCGTLGLPSGARVTGVAGATRLKFIGSGAFIVASRSNGISVSGLMVDGGQQLLDPAASDGLVTFSECTDITLRDLTVMGSLLNGVTLRGCSGIVTGCTITDCGATALLSVDAKGLTITGNRIERIGNNGIQVWRTEPGEDGTRVAHNHVARIQARAGGDGQNGNGINVFKAGGVQIEGNRITDCAFSAIRANSAFNVQIIGNSCERMGEVAIYAEFAFEGAVIANNLVDRASVGISVTNFNDGGRLAVVQGNMLRNLSRVSASGGDQGVGISVEADTAVTGNVVEGAERIGILAGYGAFRRDIAVTGNVVRSSPIGIGVSSDPGGGAVLVAQNLISGAVLGGIRLMDHETPVGADLARVGAEAANGIMVQGNVSA